MSKRTFYDVHCHAMNLSHPNLGAFLDRFIKDLRGRGRPTPGHKEVDLRGLLHLPMTVLCILGAVALLLPYLVLRAASGAFPPAKKSAGLLFDPLLRLARWGLPIIDHVICLLCAMEQSSGDLLALMAKDFEKLRRRHPAIPKRAARFDRVVLTPLIMDFGFSEREKLLRDIPYGISLKPVEDQIRDLLLGIRDFRRHHRNFSAWMEVYPFLGINTRDYALDASGRKAHRSTLRARHGEWGERILPEHDSLTTLLGRYFGAYNGVTPARRRLRLRHWVGTFDGDLDKPRLPWFFAGVKVYPPLGFDPWPREDADELEKVKLLYRTCVNLDLPLVSHCSGGGFRVDDEATVARRTSPARWVPVLEQFPRLRLNLAHFGGGVDDRDEDGWMRIVAELVQAYPNVYTDIACQCFDDNGYRTLARFAGDLKREGKHASGRGYDYYLVDKIMFGTDFMINLLWAKSYVDYLEAFARNKVFGTTPQGREFMDRLCSVNPGNFLFGRCPERQYSSDCAAFL